MPDRFKHKETELHSPLRNAFAVTPSDVNDLEVFTRALYVGTGGNIAMILAGDSASVVWPNVPSGTLLSVAAKRVLATGTTASGLIGGY